MLLALIMLGQQSWGQMQINTLGTAVTQNFNSPTTAALPAGFRMGNTNGNVSTDYTELVASSGAIATTLASNSTGNAYKFNSSSDYAIGFLNSGSFATPKSIVLEVKNNTTSPITNVTISWKYEKYRSGPRAFNWTFFHGADTAPATSEPSGDEAYVADANNTVITFTNPPTLTKSVTLTGLNIAAGANYYFRWTLLGVGGSSNGQALAIDDVVITATSVQASTTPTVSTTAILPANITAVDAIAGGNVTATGGANLTARGIVWSTVATPTVNDVNDFKTTIAGTGTSSFTSTLTSLSSNTRYYYRAYATNSQGTAYGTELSFYTLALTPASPVVSAPTATSLNLAISTNGNNAATVYAIRINGGNYIDASGTQVATPVFRTAASWGTQTVIGLANSTQYSFDVKARNGAGVETPFSQAAIGTTLSSTSPALTLVSSTLEFGNVCINSSATGSFIFNGQNLSANADIVLFPKNGITYATSQNGIYSTSLVIEDYNGGDVTVWVKFMPTAVQNYESTLLVAGQGSDSLAQLNVPFSGQGINTPGSAITNAATDITVQTSTLSGQAIASDCSAISAYGFEISTVNGFANGAGTVINASNLANTNFTAQALNLTPGTTYYFKAFATDNSGTFYGTQQSFVTSGLEIPVTTAATIVTQSSFIANWTGVPGATSYRIDVSTSPTFGTQGTPASDLFFSEYLEGQTPGNNRALEIYNGTGATVSLTDYAVVNGNGTPLELTGTIANGATYVLANTGASASTLAVANRTVAFNESNALSFTGSSAVKLLKNGAVIDEVSNEANKTLRRKGSITGPSATYDSSQWDVYAVDNNDNLGSHTYSSVPQPLFVAGYENLTVNGTSQEVAGLQGFTTYYYRVRAFSTNSTSANSNVTSVTTKVSQIEWNGTVWTPTVYPDGTPVVLDNTVAAIINGNYDTELNGVFPSKSITVTGGIFTVATGTTLTVENEINNDLTPASFVVEDNANLIQVNPLSTLNQDAITVNKNSLPLYRLDYGIYSSPVTGETLLDFSPLTAPTRFYTYTTAGDFYSPVSDPATQTFELAKGYLIRTPNTGTPAYNAGEEPMVNNAEFEGKPNNGDLTVALSTAGNGYNAVGNPYPSTLNFVDFIDGNINNIEGQVWFWRKRNNSDNTSYATMTKASYARNEAEGGGVANDAINPQTYEFNVAQGFIVKSLTNTLIFNNTMRGASYNNPLFRDGGEDVISSRYWINLTSGNTAFSQFAMAYREDATLDYDNGLDGRAFTQGATSVYTFAEGTDLSIQARPQFTDADVVPVGFKTAVAGSHSFTIENTDGLFAEGQAIYVRDNFTGTVHNLQDGAYDFVTEAGIFNGRFEIIYKNETLGNNEINLTIDNLIVYKRDANLNVNAGTAVIKGITIYDMRGRIIYTKDEVNASDTVISDLQAQQQVLIVEVITAGNRKISKKIVY